jgi:hypothetical protein
MKFRVAQTLARQSIHGRRRNRPAKRAAGAETDIVGQDEKNIRGAFGRLDLLREILGRFLNRPTDVPFEWWLGPGQHVLRPRRCREQ